MVELGYALSSEEFPPNDLVRNAQRAEEVGFTFALISDHFHPWIEAQGQAPFVWSVIGGIAATTQKLRLGTGVTCPIMRIHPVILAQAAATAATMMPGRFFFGVGTGEALNEHVLGDHWPPIQVRQDMLDEALDIIRSLWTGDEISYFGNYFNVQTAQLYTLPEQTPPIYIAASGPESAELAGDIGDGLICVVPSNEVVEAFNSNGGSDKPKIGQVKVCWAKSESEALDTLYKYWPTSVLPGKLHSELPTPEYFEDASKLVKKEDMAGIMPLGPDPKRHIDEIKKMIDTGFDQIYIHQIGQDQEGFFDFFQSEIMPYFQSQTSPAAG